LANFVAQTEALMIGKSADVAERELRASGMNDEQVRQILPHKVSSSI
jgi:glucose-6-phosphate isomerase